jgi:hypothetical protein
MAKKVVATLKTGKGNSFTKVIKVIRSPKTGAYAFREEIVQNELVADYLKNNLLYYIKESFFRNEGAFLFLLY